MIAVHEEERGGLADQTQVRALKRVALSHARLVDEVGGDLVDAEVVADRQVEIRVVRGGGLKGADVKIRLEGATPSKIVAKEPQALARAIIEVVQTARSSTGRAKLIADRLTEEAVAEVIREVYLRVAKGE